jgi:archaellum component FlaC
VGRPWRVAMSPGCVRLRDFLSRHKATPRASQQASPQSRMGKVKAPRSVANELCDAPTKDPADHAEVANKQENEEVDAVNMSTAPNVDGVIHRMQAENKMLGDALAGMENKLESFRLKYDELKHEHTSTMANNVHLAQLIRAAEASFYEILENQICKPESTIDWALCYGRLVAAVRPVFMHRQTSAEHP